MFDGDPFVQRRPTRNKNMSITVPVTLEEAFQGIKRQISVQLGSGQRQVVDLDIPAGVNNGMTLNYKGLGDNSVKGVPAGDLQVRLQVNRHAFFERKNHDLYTSKQINAFEAMLGTKVIIKTINLKTIKATVVPGTQPGTFIRIPNEGMPIMRTNNRGHLFVRIDINIPSNLTQEEKEIITKNFIK
jgi:curved DNA-binding protein